MAKKPKVYSMDETFSKKGKEFTKGYNKESREIAVAASEETLAALRSEFPVENSFQRVLLPRLTMYSQDKYEGKGRTAKLVKEAGMFVTEHQTDELDAAGKKVWAKTELGTSAEGIIVYQRKQLRYYDEATETYTSSPIYDTDEDVVPLFKDKVEIARGTPAELKATYAFIDPKDGKTKSKLEDNRILYVLVDDTVYQMNLRGSSMYAWMAYARKVLPPAVLTSFNSEAKEKGSIFWNQMTFTALRNLSEEEINSVRLQSAGIRAGIEAEKAWYAQQRPTSSGNTAMDKAAEDF